jgi:hypothetical protein
LKRRSALPVADSGLTKVQRSVHEEGTCQVQRIASYPKVTVCTGGRGVCSHVGSRLLADVVAAAGVGEAFDAAVGAGRRRRSAHPPGRVLADLAVMLADGGVTIGDLAVLRDQPAVFGPVASTATAWRVLDSVDESLLDQVKLARAAARERAWWLRGEAGCGVLAVRRAGTVVPGLVIDLDATLVTCHSEKQVRQPTSTGMAITPACLAGQHRGGVGGDAAARERECQCRPPTTSA